MKDFYFQIKKALKTDKLKELIRGFQADPNLTYTTSSEIIEISSMAFGDLVNISQKSLGHFKYNEDGEEGIFLATEIAFTGIFDRNRRCFLGFIKGDTGDKNMCSWTDGNFLKLSCKKAKKLNGQIVLGHTHPVIIPNSGPKRKYGAICSKIYWTKKDLENFGDPLALKQLQTGIYKRFGGDYGEMWTLSQQEKLISNFALIMSPALNQLGIFEINKNGVIIYHPWKVQP